MARLFKTGITAESGITADIINASSVSSTTADIFGNVTTGTVGIADGLTTGTLNIGNGTTSSTGRTININTNASSTVTVTTNIGSPVIGSTINLVAGSPGVVLTSTGLITTSAVTGGASSIMTIRTGNTTTSGNSGNLFLDVGSAAGTAGTVSVGTSSASGVSIGRAGITTSVTGTLNHAGASSPIQLNSQAGTTGQVLTSAGAGATPTWGNFNALRWRTGAYYAPNSATAATVSGNLTSVYMVPVYIPNAITLTKIGVNVATAATTPGATIRLGIYSNTNSGASDLPNTRILDAGTVASDSTGYKEITISQAITPGIYWMALQYLTITAGVTGVNSYNPGIAVLTANPTIFYSGYTVSTTAGAALPAGPVTILNPTTISPRTFLGT